MTNIVFNVHSAYLKNALEKLSKVINKNSLIPELRQVKFRIHSFDLLVISGTNLKFYGIEELPTETIKHEVSPDTLVELLFNPVVISKALKREGIIQFRIDSHKLKAEMVLPGNVSISLWVNEPDDFPENVSGIELEAEKHTLVPIPYQTKEQKKTALKALSFGYHCSHLLDNSLQGFRGAYFIPDEEGKNVSVFSVDGNRLAFTPLDTLSPGKLDLKGFAAIDMDGVKVIEHYMKKDTSSQLSLEFSYFGSKKVLTLRGQNSKVSILSSQAEMMDFEEYLPSDAIAGQETGFHIKTDELLNLFKEFSGISSDFRSGFVRESENNKLELVFAAAEPSESTVTIPLVSNSNDTDLSNFSLSLGNGPGKRKNFYLNQNYMMDALKTFSSEYINIGSEGEGYPIYLYGSETAEKCVIMGLSLR